MMYIIQITMLYTLNLYSAVCQLHLNKTGEKKKYSLYATSLGFWGDTSSKEPTWQCRRHKRHRFNPWVGKIPWWQAWQPAMVLFPGESLGQRRLADYCPWGHKESDTTTNTTIPHIYVHQWYWAFFFFNYFLVWFWYQGNPVFKNGLWKCSLSSFLKYFKKDRHCLFFNYLVETSESG